MEHLASFQFRTVPILTLVPPSHVIADKKLQQEDVSNSSPINETQQF